MITVAKYITITMASREIYCILSQGLICGPASRCSGLFSKPQTQQITKIKKKSGAQTLHIASETLHIAKSQIVQCFAFQDELKNKSRCLIF